VNARIHFPPSKNQQKTSMIGTHSSYEDLLIRNSENPGLPPQPRGCLKPALHLLDMTKKGGSGVSGIVSIETL